MKQAEFFAKWSALHGNAEIKGIVRAWLKISFTSAKFVSVLRLTPNFLTLLGIVFAIAMAANPLSPMASMAASLYIRTARANSVQF
jgi:archaetidylinositol phosphate synthase